MQLSGILVALHEAQRHSVRPYTRELVELTLEFIRHLCTRVSVRVCVRECGTCSEHIALTRGAGVASYFPQAQGAGAGAGGCTSRREYDGDIPVVGGAATRTLARVRYTPPREYTRSCLHAHTVPRSILQRIVREICWCSATAARTRLVAVHQAARTMARIRNRSSLATRRCTQGTRAATMPAIPDIATASAATTDTIATHR